MAVNSGTSLSLAATGSIVVKDEAEKWETLTPVLRGADPGHDLKAVRFSFADQHGVLRGKTLAAAEVGAALERGYTLCKRYVDELVMVDDAQIIDAMRLLFDEMKLANGDLVEVDAGHAKVVAPAYRHAIVVDAAGVFARVFAGHQCHPNHAGAGAGVSRRSSGGAAGVAGVLISRRPPKLCHRHRQRRIFPRRLRHRQISPLSSRIQLLKSHLSHLL